MGSMNKNLPKTLYHGSGIEITDGFIRVKPAHINHMQTPVTAVFATPSFRRATLYAVMRLIGGVMRFPREHDKLYIDKLKQNIPEKAYVYELDSDGFEQDGSDYYALEDRKINKIYQVDIMQEIKNGKIKVYVLKDQIDFKHMPKKQALDFFHKIVEEHKDKFELYKPDSKKLEMQILAKTLENSSKEL